MRRIPTAVFFDIDKVCDQNTNLPHMLPNEVQFGQMMGELGLSEKDTIVVYDSKGMFSSPRVWYTFRVFGVNKVAILLGLENNNDKIITIITIITILLL